MTASVCAAPTTTPAKAGLRPDKYRQESAPLAYAQLCLNFNNPLIKKLARVRGRSIVRRAVEMLYVQALLLGHYPLKAKEMQLLSEGLLGLIEIGLGVEEGDPSPDAKGGKQ